VLLVLFLLHGSLIFIFLREQPGYIDRTALPEVLTTLFFVDPPARTPPSAPQAYRSSPKPSTPTSRLDITAPEEIEPPPPLSAPVDWVAEAHQSAAEIAAREQPGTAVQTPPSPTNSAPWDARPLLESTRHGLKLRIPVEIPGKWIDHCFGNLDVGHEQTGQWQKYQLGCAFGKRPARGDLFDSVRKPHDQ
jgi:hypothetical protein